MELSDSAGVAEGTRGELTSAGHLSSVRELGGLQTLSHLILAMTL